MDYLFRYIREYDYFNVIRDRLRTEIGSLSEEELQSSDESLKIIFAAKYTIPPIEFGNESRKDHGEIEKEITHDERFFASMFREPEDPPVYKKAREIEIHLPFSSDEELFDVQPSTTYPGHFPMAEIKNNEVVFTIDFFGDLDKPEEVEHKIKKQVTLIKDYANWLNGNIITFNDSLDPEINSGLFERRKKLLQDNVILQKLGVQKQVLVSGFVKPLKKVELKILEDAGKQIDPSLEMETYEEIISIINSLGVNLERSCQRLRESGEVPLRDTMLMALNSIYPGMVSGETYNKEGKTDIILRYRDRNLFVGECKIWSTEDVFTEGIDQLLSYLTWRDTKTSYIIFSKNKNVKNVITKLKALVESNPNFLTKVKDVSDSCITYKFRLSPQTSSECFLTMHVIDLGSN